MSLPTESSILTNFLLTPAPLPVAITLDQFTSLFPRQYQTSDDIRVLYHELQRQVTQGIDQVESNITAQVQLGEKQKRQVARSRRRQHHTQTHGVDIQHVIMDLAVRHNVPNSMSSSKT
jgi:centromere-localized protein 2